MESNLKGLARLRQYKESILEAIISDEELVKAIHNNNEEFLQDPVEDPAKLLYKQIFPFKWAVPEIPDRKEVYITMTFQVDGMSGGIFNKINFNIFVFVHKDIMRVDNGERFMLRSDFIMEKLEALFHDSRDFGVGRLKLYNTGEVFISTDLPGFFVSFETVDQAAER